MRKMSLVIFEKKISNKTSIIQKKYILSFYNSFFILSTESEYSCKRGYYDSIRGENKTPYEKTGITCFWSKDQKNAKSENTINCT